jgi:hypothetical protein
MMSKRTTCKALVVQATNHLAVIDKPLANYDGEILFGYSQSMIRHRAAKKLTPEQARVGLYRLCFLGAGIFFALSQLMEAMKLV